MGIVQSGLPLALLMPFVLAAWIAVLHRRQACANQIVAAHATVEAARANSIGTCFVETSVDFDTVLREAMVTVQSAARSRWVTVEFAGFAPVAVQADPAALRIALRDTLLTAINAAAGGKVLVTAAASGNQLQIRITDDGPWTDQAVRETTMRRIDALIAMQGGSSGVEARPGRGTTVTIRLPAQASAAQPASGIMQCPVLADQAA